MSLTPWLAALWGCGPSYTIAEESRSLEPIAGDGWTITPRARRMAWHHPATWGGEWFAFGYLPRHDMVMVGFDLGARRGEAWLLECGEGDHSEWTESPCAGWNHGEAVHASRAVFQGMRSDGCAATDRFAYRVSIPGYDAPWRAGFLVDDRVVFGFVDGAPATCAEALDTLPPATDWVRDHARGDSCGCLIGVDPALGVRCGLREADPRGLGAPSRGTPSHTSPDAAVLAAALDPGLGDTTTFAPYRVRAAIDAVADPFALEPTQRRLEARCAGDCLPWEAVALGRIAGRREDRAACRALLERADARLSAGDELAAAAALSGAVGCGIDDELRRRMLPLWTRPEPPLSSPASWSCPPEHTVGEMMCETLTDLATGWLAATCDPEVAEQARRLAADPATPTVTRDRARRIAPCVDARRGAP